MAFELNDGQGTLFTNDKGDNDKRPDRTGELNVNGVLYKLSGWIKQGPKGPWLSIKAEPRDAQQPKRAEAPIPDLSGEIPF